ncbi:TIGR02678 family protein [Nocardiopsis ganjiahuensis]|uniref:TIGR02678 family protein n=1 Tax=Nocardiopsis ganjiahuensis TaxID=239984 RepID=UPI000348153D|nr:TIGR02678 family protein [Nocardiopsis ganjiahuensis]
METNAHMEDAALIGERQAAARALMSRPLLTRRTHPAEFSLVRSHAEWLIQRFQRVLGYRLTVADDHARLVKRGLVDEVVLPTTRSTGARFTPRTHTYLALALAVLVEQTGPTTVRSLAVRVRAAAREAGVDADPARGLGERRAFCAALQYLVGLGALAETSGSVRAHQADAAVDAGLAPDTEALRSVTAHLPKAGDDPVSFLADAADTDPESDQAGEVALRRLLAETAVVYREQLPDRQRDRLAAHQWRAAAALGNLLGCDTEIRAEGVALVMPDEAAATPRFPSDDPVGHTALALVRHLSGRLHPGRPATSVPVPDQELLAALEVLGGADAPIRSEWARTAGPELPAPDRLSGLVLELLTGLGLLTGGPGTWALTAAAARFGADVDDRVPRIQDNDEDSRTHPTQPRGSGHGEPEDEADPQADPRGDLDRVASVLQAVANEKVSATSGDTGDERGPRDGSG